MPLRLEGGRTRTVFWLAIELQKLEATFNYEGADVAPLASLSVQASSRNASGQLPCTCLSACDRRLLEGTSYAF